MRSGLLDVEVIADAAGRTRVRRLEQSYPQRVTTALHVDADPRSAYLCVQSPSGGIFPDDTLRTAVTAGTGSHLLLTSQSASQVFAGDAGPGARHRQSIAVRSGAVVEYLPREIIPHADAGFDQHTEVDVEGDGVYVGWEMLAAGRVGHGESYGYRSLSTRTEVRVDGTVVARDALQLGKANHALRQRILGGQHIATLVVVAPTRAVDHVCDEIGSLVATGELPGIAGGVGLLPGECGVLVRLLGDRATPLRSVLSQLVTVCRRTLLAMGPPPARIV